MTEAVPPPGCPHHANQTTTSAATSSSPSLTNDHFPLEDALPLEGQRIPLSTVAEASRIPNAEDSTWVFPSPQRFYNAMVRKGWQPNEKDMPMVVSVHNTVNHRTWSRVMQFESFHAQQCMEPKLVRFRGRPQSLSPKARLRKLTGAHPPFDRHDWIVDRCGKEIRYVIDFYTGQEPDSPDLFFGPSLFIEARPAVSWGGLVDRARMLWEEKILKRKVVHPQDAVNREKLRALATELLLPPEGESSSEGN